MTHEELRSLYDVFPKGEAQRLYGIKEDLNEFLHIELPKVEGDIFADLHDVKLDDDLL